MKQRPHRTVAPRQLTDDGVQEVVGASTKGKEWVSRVGSSVLWATRHLVGEDWLAGISHTAFPRPPVKATLVLASLSVHAVPCLGIPGSDPCSRSCLITSPLPSKHPWPSSMPTPSPPSSGPDLLCLVPLHPILLRLIPVESPEPRLKEEKQNSIALCDLFTFLPKQSSFSGDHKNASRYTEARSEITENWKIAIINA